MSNENEHPRRPEKDDATRTEGSGARHEPHEPVADATVVRPPPDPEAPAVPGYDLVRVLGRGGMGVVWEAVEHRLERRVALKVHSETEGPSEGLWTEALVAARIADPSIVGVLDVGFTLDQRPYYAMELVEGTDLAAVLADGPLPPRRAIAIAADVARAAGAAHAHGVVHRDLKPRNVIVDATGRARVVDFGIAFDTRKGLDPHAGRLAGSPPFMAPEQVTGGEVGPWTDLWGIGVMLYEMLTGVRPFASATLKELFGQILNATPPPPSALAPAVHADLDEVVLRCLEKAPERRYPNATVLFETLTSLLEGAPVSRPPMHSYTPRAHSSARELRLDRPRREHAKKHLAWTWRLASPPQALWPFVADTDRFNKAVGLSPVSFTAEPKPDGSIERTGEMRVLGMSISWREFPFEWVKEREHSVFRWYRSGPLEALWNRVSLMPIAGGGTELRHEIWLTPRGVIGQVAAFVELDRKLAMAVDRFYRRLDELLVTGAPGDPFEAPHTPSFEERAVVEQGCAALHAAGFGPAIVERLAMHLLSAPTGVLTTLRPYELAHAWRTDRHETLDACIHAARIGLLEPMWDVICPRCLVAHETQAELEAVKQHGRCDACAAAFERDLASGVELVFAPAPRVRMASRQTYCVGSPARRPHVTAQQVLEPGESRELVVGLPRGTYRVVGQVASHGWELVASAVGFETTCEVVATPAHRVEGRPDIVRAGPVTVRLRNDGAATETFRIEAAGLRQDVVSAAAALTHPTFRSFFSDQLLAQGEHVRVSHLAFVFVELGDRAILFETLGDAAACAELARLDALASAIARDHEGDLVPSALSLLVVALPSSPRAFRAALDLRERIARGPAFSAPIAIAVHDGRCIALTRSGRPEFFGETLDRGQALLAECPPGGIALSASVMAERAVAIGIHETNFAVTVRKTDDGPYAGRRVTLLRPRDANAA